ncbi:MAG: efflux transporter periplasmic adaptor subunit [Massilia sp.]|jgi:RND family efflux transporter MFP subunit|nr:efflux transporter periplasmic adaptor subunit [Massilia sp.]MDB5950440.1 efflux transporter periplasmic adaptor subunit [Massilia sp.]
MKSKKLVLFLLLAAIGIGVAATQAGWFGTKPALPAPKQAPLVTLSSVPIGDMPVVLTAQGHVTPLNQVEIRPQITGIIREVHFREGDRVTAGQLLFTLDPGESDAVLSRARSQETQVKAQLKDAQRSYQRTQEMVASGFMAHSAVDTASSKLEELQAQRAASGADIDNARIQRSRTRIVAPISGRTGAVRVHPGSLAQASAAEALVTIVQLDPIGVAFDLPEKHLAALRAAQARGLATIALDGAAGGGQVGAVRRNGTLSFVDSAIDMSSGTITLKASFANRDQLLWPGAFVRLELGVGSDSEAAALPPHAIVEGPHGPLVYVVGADGKAQARPVALLRVQHQDAIVTGLRKGERVVVEGMLDVRPGAQVRIAQAATGNTP